MSSVPNEDPLHGNPMLAPRGVLVPDYIIEALLRLGPEPTKRTLEYWLTLPPGSVAGFDWADGDEP